IHVFDALCYPKNDRKDIGKLGVKGDIGFFIGYSADSCAYRVYNRRTKKIIETMNVLFDDLLVMAFEQRSSKPELNSMTSGQICSGLDLTYAPSTITTQQPTEGSVIASLTFFGSIVLTVKAYMHMSPSDRNEDSASLVDELAKGFTNALPLIIAFELISSTSCEVIGIFVA
nr:integrase, catalytic region, zinc finger, CCHC-type, peptidase aspartic, catalytic [Tanacetum cinerariifolium]